MPPGNNVATLVSSSSGRRAWLISTVLLLVVLALGNIPLLSGSAGPQWDAVDFFGPSFALVADQLRAGHLVKWNPWTAGGTPDWAEPELGTASPILLAVSLLSLNPQEGYIAYWVLIWAFGGIGMLLLTRHLGCPAWGGAIAAYGFVASGFHTGHAEHTSSIVAVSFLPWILWRLDAGLQNRDWWCGVQAGALYGLSALSGYPAFTILTPAFLIMWILGRVLWPDSKARKENEPPTPAFAVILLTLTAVLGIIILSPVYLGTLLGTRGYSDRVGPRPRAESVSSNLLEVGAVSTLASPYLANLNIYPRQLWPKTDVSMTSVYSGAPIVILALFGSRLRSRWRWWLVLMGIFFTCCALGSQLPLRGWLYDYVIPTRYFRNPALFRAYLIFLIDVLAALATRDVAEALLSKADLLRLWLLSIFLACSAVVSFGVVCRIAAKSVPGLRPGVVHLLIVWFGFAALTYLLKQRYISQRTFLRLLMVLCFVDAVGALYISRPTMYTPATIPWWHEMNAHHSATPDLTSAGFVRILHSPESLGSYPNNRNLSLKISVFDSYIVFWNRFHQQMVADPLLSRMAIGADRLWFLSVVAWRAPSDASFKPFQERVRELAGVPVLILHSRKQMLALASVFDPQRTRDELVEPPKLPACVLATVSDVSYQTDSLSFLYAAPASGYLLVTDRWADGWAVTVNGQRRPVLGGNFIYRAVQVDGGTNVIQFRYNPRGLRPLLFLSWGTLVFITAWQIHRLARRATKAYRLVLSDHSWKRPNAGMGK